MNSSHDAEIAWAAGLFDAEGSTTANGPWDTPHVVVPQSGEVEIAPEVLIRFRLVVGVGKIYGPSLRGHRPAWRFCVTGPRAVGALHLLWSRLDVVKRDQASAVLARYRSHPTRSAAIAAATGRPLKDAR